MPVSTAGHPLATHIHPVPIWSGPPKEQGMRINVPTKTQLYIDQAKRERENAQSMYKVFQRDLASLQLIAARQYAKVVSKKMTATVTVEDVQMQVRVLKG